LKVREVFEIDIVAIDFRVGPAEAAMLTQQNIESELSYAYLHAVASRAGIICEYTGRHTDEAGVDAVLRVKGKLAPDSILTQFPVEVQLKSTKVQPLEQDGKYSYSIKLKNYDELRSIHTGAPQLLIVMYLPSDPSLWIHHSADGLVARRCAYWVSLRGAASTTQGSKTVYIPTSNVVAVDSLMQLMTRFSKREVIDYVE
jgi:hypothetical protein